MSDSTNDPFELLRASDPAVSATPDAAAIRQSVSAQVGGELDAIVMTPVSTIEPARSHHLWLGVAAGVAALALAAGVGFGVGRSNSSSSVASGVSSSDVAVAPMPGMNAAGGGTVSTMPVQKDSMMVSGRTVFESKFGAETMPGLQLHAYAYDAPSVDGKTASATLAKAFGIAAGPVDQGGMWVAGAVDGSASSVSLSSDGVRSFWANNPALQPAPCAIAVPGSPGVAEPALGAPNVAPSPMTEPSMVASPVPAPSCPSTTPLPATTVEGAMTAAQDFMKAVGVDPQNFRFTNSDPQCATQLDVRCSSVNVMAEQQVQGFSTGQVWSFMVVGGGQLASVNGSLAPLVDLGAYPLVGEGEGVARLNDPRFGGSYGGPIAMATDAKGGVAVASDGSGASAGGAPSVPNASPPAMTVTPGSALPWPVTHIDITSAKPALLSNYQPDGSVQLLPAWSLHGSDGVDRLVNAVVESKLQLTQ